MGESFSKQQGNQEFEPNLQTPQQDEKETGQNRHPDLQRESSDPDKRQPPESNRTFTRDDFNRAVAAERRKAAEEARNAAMQEFEEKQNKVKQRQAEAEKFSKLQAEEQVRVLQERLETLEREKTEIQLQREADNLRQKAIEKATAAKLPISFVSDIDYRNIDAEKLDDLIQDRWNDFNREVENRLNEILPNRTPQTHKEISDPYAWQKPSQPAGQRKPWEKFTNR